MMGRSERLAGSTSTMRMVLVCLCLIQSRLPAMDGEPAFFRGLNLNGPALQIDGRLWEGSDSPHYESDDRAFASQNVSLIPATDDSRATMIRSSRWGGNHVKLTDVPPGEYTVFLYVWEDNDAETYSISLNGTVVHPRYDSRGEGHWERLGPWPVTNTEGHLVVESRGGAANFSGIEIWQGQTTQSSASLFTSDDMHFFESRIRPLLVQHCYECHSTDSEDPQGELLVDSRPALLRGGIRGPAIVPGKLKQSLLLTAVEYADEEMQMPPDGRLSEREIRDLRVWIERGAPDPRLQPTRITRPKIDIAAARDFWSFQPVADPAPPEVSESDWVKSPIDSFVLARQESANLKHASRADRRTLIRRATFDLIGLPPTPDEIKAFLNDDSEDAFTNVVDRLLASPHYGERWGRHWMDLVRYADTAGDNSDYPIPSAWRYRNYIIDAFNADKPYDQFLREQIAGDLLPAADDQTRNEQIVATGYLAVSRRFGSIIDGYPQHLTIEDTIDNVGRSILGMTVSCARCHDHKFDPISQDDYYALYGIFASTRYPFPGIELDKKPRDFVPLLKDGKPGPDLAYAMAEGKPADTPLHTRGEPERPGHVVPRGFPRILGGQTLPADARTQSGRRQLADWLTSEDTPLTSRVIVNRIWQHHFGQGLVSTPSDFGTRGTPPSHPQLLDWLATTFVESDWSIKAMHRHIMLSATYQQDSKLDAVTQNSHTPEQNLRRALESDPANTLLWRFTRRRMEAETLRDTLLLLSGDLESSQPREPHPFPPSEKWDYTQHHPFRDCYESNQRSVYLMTARLNARPFFTTFDGADRNASTPQRDDSVTTVQSLYLLNAAFVHERANGFAGRLLAESGDRAQRADSAFLQTLGRPMTDTEQQAAAQWFADFEKTLSERNMSAAERELETWAAFCRVLFRLNEFLYID